MGKRTLLILATLIIIPAIYLYPIFKDYEPPTLPEHYWGPKSKLGGKEDASIRPFEIAIDDKVLTDFRNRLKLEVSAEGKRLIPPLEGIGFQYGFNTDFLKTVAEHWLTKYDWKVREKELNKYPHFKTNIAGIEIHFQHVKSSTGQKKYKTTRPLLLLHGWPGSFVEFQKVIPLLTDPEDSEVNFELIIPSLPGYGFSEGAHRPGLGPAEISQIFVKLMKRLGHEKFYMHGGDWGSLIGSDMATIYPKNLMAAHISPCASFHTRASIRTAIASLYPTLFMEQSEADRIYPYGKWFANILEESGYLHIQSTKPDTVGVGLSNSPMGLAAYILEKFASWTNIKMKTEVNGGLVPYYHLDDLLDNVMVYWITNTITTSMRLYSEFFGYRQLGMKLNNIDNCPVSIPVGCLSGTNEFWNAQSKWILQDKFPQIVQYTNAGQGGHFSAFELPQIFAKDVVKFFNRVESRKI